jgi:HEAT repeat protein
MPDGPRYDDDFYAWTQHQAAVLREMRVSDNRFDREHVAEEIEDLGKSERDAMRSQIRRIIEHLLKLAFSPAEPPRFAWMETILDARQALSDKMSPSLRRDAEASLGRLFADARKRAEASLSKYGEPEAAAAMPQICPFSLDDICREDWYPERPGAQP